MVFMLDQISARRSQLSNINWRHLPVAGSILLESEARGQEAHPGEPPKDNKPNPKDILSKPIPGPQHVGPDWLTDTDYEKPLGPVGKVGRFVAETVRFPARWVRENIVLPNKGPKYYWYHRKYPRALPIDECYMDDFACQQEAELEYQRIHNVDREVLNLLRYRRDACHLWWSTKHNMNRLADECQEISETYYREETNFHIKYGDLRSNDGVVAAYNKQKARMIVDRRRALKKQQEEAEAKLD